MKFSVVPLSIRVTSSAMPLNECNVMGTSSLLSFLNMYIVRRQKVQVKAANLVLSRLRAKVPKKASDPFSYAIFGTFALSRDNTKLTGTLDKT
jgi:hypothetical protein